MKKVIDIYKYKKAAQPKQTLFNTSGIVYPTIEGNTSNFITDYIAGADEFDLYAARKHGEKWFDGVIVESEDDIITEWNMATNASIMIHRDAWARLYYALSLKYNPIWNVDGTTTFEHGEVVRTDDIAERTDTTNLDAIGGSNTDYATAYDSGTEKETGKSEYSEDAKENSFTAGAHLDTYTTEEYTDTETRTGNIGVTQTQQMLNAEWEFRKKSFFDYMIKIILKDCGCIYRG